MVRALNHFRHRRHEVIVFHVLDKAEIEFPFRDTIAFHDLETDERIQIDPAYVRDEYVAQIEAFIADYRRACAEAGIDYVLTDTGVPYDFMLSKYLAKRSRSMTFAAPLFLIGRPGRRDSDRAAHGQSPEGEGAAVFDAAVPQAKRGEDAAAAADPRRAADGALRGGAAAAGARAGPARGDQVRLALGQRADGRGHHSRQLGQHGA